MDRLKLVEALSAYRRPGTPVYAYHFRNLPEEVLQDQNAGALRAVLQDDSLTPRVREHAAGALGELRDQRSVTLLIEALGSAKLRRGAAVALGLIRDQRAVPALGAAAPRCKAARWALGQFDRNQSTDQLLTDLREGHLREIGRKLAAAPTNHRRAVVEQALRELKAVVTRGTLGQEHRWLMTVLQYAEDPAVDAVLAEALRLTVRKRGICPTVRGRLLRVIGARLPTTALPALVDVACQTDDPGQAQMAAVSIGKLVHCSNDAKALADKSRPRMLRQLKRLRRLRGETRPKAPPRAWERTPGSPGWFAAIDRATRALERLLA